MLTDAALAARLQRHVDDGEVPGLVALVSAHEPGVPSTTGEVAVAAIGVKAFGDTEPIGRDAIFRIASISKPIVAVAAMMLVDDGTIALDEPVDAWLPEMAARRVMRTPDGPIDDTVPAKRAITVRDLLSFRMGFGVLMRAPGSTPIQRAEEALQLRTMGPPWPPPHLTPDGWIAALGTLPLMHQPGEGWMYNTGLQVLGVLLERATSTPLQALLRARLFDPLGMADTGFHVPSSELHRLTTQYDPGDGTMQVLDDPSSSWWATPPAMPNAAGWLVSTIDDLWSFVRFVIEGGRRDDEQLLSPGSMDEPVDGSADGRRPARQRGVPRRWQLGTRDGRSRRRADGPRCDRLGRWYGHVLADRHGQRHDADPPHPASDDVTRTARRVRRLRTGSRRARAGVMTFGPVQAPPGDVHWSHEDPLRRITSITRHRDRGLAARCGARSRRLPRRRRARPVQGGGIRR